MIPRTEVKQALCITFHFLFLLIMPLILYVNEIVNPTFDFLIISSVRSYLSGLYPALYPQSTSFYASMISSLSLLPEGFFFYPQNYLYHLSSAHYHPSLKTPLLEEETSSASLLLPVTRVALAFSSEQNKGQAKCTISSFLLFSKQ